MNETLYDRVTKAKKDESIHDILASLNLDGYKYLMEWDINENLKDDIVKYVAYSYSYQSPYLRKSKNRSENKRFVCKKVGIDYDDNDISEAVKNKNKHVNKFITWWLKETADPLWKKIITGMDLEDDLLEFARTGIEATIHGKDARAINAEMKRVKSDSDLKAKAFLNAGIIRKQIDSDIGELERVGYGALELVVKEDLPEEVRQGESYPEYIARTTRRYENKSQQKQSNPALQESGDRSEN